VKRVTYHVGGYVSGAAHQNISEEWDSVANTFTTWDVLGNQTLQRPLTAGEQSQFADELAADNRNENKKAVNEKAQQALTANAAYLAIPAPTAAEVRSQTELLTKEVNGLIRLLINRLDDISDT